MGIDKIRLGPRSRVLQAQEEQEQVAHPPTPGPANPTSILGCACGRWHVPDRKARVEKDGVVHRYGGPCYQAEPSGDLERTRLELLRAQDELRHLRNQLNAIRAVLARRPDGSAWDDASEPISTFPGQDPEAGGFRP